MSDARKDPLNGRTGDEQVQSEGHFISDEEMKKRLSDELEEMLMNATEHDLDVDKLDGILAALEELDPLPESEALDTEAGLRRLHERLAEQENAGDESAAVNSISSQKNRAKRRTVLKVLLVAAILALLFAIPVQGNRSLFKLIIGQTSETFRVGSADVQYAQITKQPLEQDETRYYDSVQDMMDDFGITAPLFPTWVPERFGEPEIYATVANLGVCFYISYQSGDEFLLMIANEIDSSYSYQVESYQISEQAVKINGITFYLISDVSVEKASWQNGTLDCRITGTVSEEEMRQMIASIYGG